MILIFVLSFLSINNVCYGDFAHDSIKNSVNAFVISGMCMVDPERQSCAVRYDKISQGAVTDDLLQLYSAYNYCPKDPEALTAQNNISSKTELQTLSKGSERSEKHKFTLNIFANGIKFVAGFVADKIKAIGSSIATWFSKTVTTIRGLFVNNVSGINVVAKPGDGLDGITQQAQENVVQKFPTQSLEDQATEISVSSSEYVRDDDVGVFCKNNECVDIASGVGNNTKEVGYYKDSDEVREDFSTEYRNDVCRVLYEYSSGSSQSEYGKDGRDCDQEEDVDDSDDRDDDKSTTDKHNLEVVLGAPLVPTNYVTKLVHNLVGDIDTSLVLNDAKGTDGFCVYEKAAVQTLVEVDKAVTNPDSYLDSVNKTTQANLNISEKNPDSYVYKSTKDLLNDLVHNFADTIDMNVILDDIKNTNGSDVYRDIYFSGIDVDGIKKEAKMQNISELAEDIKNTDFEGVLSEAQKFRVSFNWDSIARGHLYSGKNPYPLWTAAELNHSIDVSVDNLGFDDQSKCYDVANVFWPPNN